MMKFVIKKIEEKDWFVDGEYKFSKDSTLMFSSFCGEYEILLGKGYHLSLDVDGKTGRCYGFYTLFDAIKKIIKYEKLTIPQNYKSKLYFQYNKIFGETECHYIPFAEKCYWDNDSKILCIGDNEYVGETIEFATKTYAVINDCQLKAIYIKLEQLEYKTK